MYVGYHRNGAKMRTDKWTTSKSIQLPTKACIKLLLLLENALKLIFEVLQHKNWTLSKAPSTLWPHHQHTHITGQKKLHMGLSLHALNSRIQDKITATWKKYFTICGFSQKNWDTPTKTRWSWAQFQKDQPTCTPGMLLPAHL